MRRSLRLMALGLLAFGIAAAAHAGGAKATTPADGATCGDYGTAVEFEASPKDAARKALKEEKLVLVLHVSGDFEEPDFT